jgi:hypothetical protein
MIRSPWLRLALMLSLCLFTSGMAGEPKPVLEFERLDLSDGRKLRKVVVKTYDAEKGRLMLVASGKAMIVGIELVPEPFRGKLKEETPRAGGSTSSTPPTRIRPATPPNPAPPPVAPPPPGHASRPSIDPEAHKAAALERAQNFYRYEHKAGSDSIRVTAVNFETDDPEAITGWEGRYRIQGRVLLEYFDSKGYSFNRATDRFDVITEQKGAGSIKVIDFSRK